MKGYYIFSSEKGINSSSGVKKKIERHIKVLNKHTDVIAIPLEFEINMLSQLMFRLPYISRKGCYAETLNKLEKPDFIYIRRDNLDKDYYAFLKAIRNKWPQCKIIVELFTYPYDIDDFFRSFGKTITRFPLFLKDHHYRWSLKGIIDRFVVYSDDDEVFGIPTIKTINGYDVSSIEPCHPSIDKYDRNSPINLLAVAYLQPQHGYERIVRGLADYYQSENHSREVFFHIVGDGPEKKRYQKMVRRYGLEKHVIFYGKKTGKELENIYNTCDIGMCSFGMYKYGLQGSSSLKIPEYLSVGLPIVTGCRTSMLGNEKLKYCLEFPNDRGNIDILKVIRFYDSMYGDINRKDLIMNIRDYAGQHFSEDLAFEPIIGYLKE